MLIGRRANSLTLKNASMHEIGGRFSCDRVHAIDSGNDEETQYFLTFGLLAIVGGVLFVMGLVRQNAGLQQTARQPQEAGFPTNHIGFRTVASLER